MMIFYDPHRRSRRLAAAAIVAVVLAWAWAVHAQVVGSTLCTEAALEEYWEPLYGSWAEWMQWLYCCGNFGLCSATAVTVAIAG